MSLQKLLLQSQFEHKRENLATPRIRRTISYRGFASSSSELYKKIQRIDALNYLPQYPGEYEIVDSIMMTKIEN